MIVHAPDTASHVYFYGPEFYCLSNFSAFTLRWRDYKFYTSEAAYQWEKFYYANPELDNNLVEVRDAIRFAESAHVAFKIAESAIHLRNPMWSDLRLFTMEQILMAKINQHEYVRRKLLETGTREIVEDSWRDDYWGIGPDGEGQNHLGKLWMKVRAKLRS